MRIFLHTSAPIAETASQEDLGDTWPDGDWIPEESMRVGEGVTASEVRSALKMNLITSKL